MKVFLCFAYFIFVLSLCSCNDMQPCTLSGIENIKVLNMTSNNVELELDAIIKNPNGFGFNIYPSDFDISIGNTSMGKAGLKDKLHIDANSEIRHKIVVRSDLSKVLSNGIISLMSMMQNPIIGVKGELKAGNMFYKKRFPVDIKEKISLN